MFRIVIAACWMLAWMPLGIQAQPVATPPVQMTATPVPRVPFKEEQELQPPTDASDDLGFIPPGLNTATPVNLSALQATLAAVPTLTPIATPVITTPTPAFSTITSPSVTPTPVTHSINGGK